jgi:hypothetical protein
MQQRHGERVITDLASRTDLWVSFLFTKPIFAPDENGLSFGGVIDTLLAMASYRPMPETSIIHFVAYPADTLYILTQNQDTKGVAHPLTPQSAIIIFMSYLIALQYN